MMGSWIPGFQIILLTRSAKSAFLAHRATARGIRSARVTDICSHDYCFGGSASRPWRAKLIARLLQPHATKSLRTVPARILSVVAKNQNPRIVVVAGNHNRLGIEIAEINPDILWLSARLPPKNA